ncbi:MAG: sensor histidine kinase [Oscillospiraceae bacterium]|nr:sensor histidine kinase [Oscillospiraceae bacterium]
MFLIKLISAVVAGIAAVTVTTLVIVLTEMNSRYINSKTSTALMIVEKTRREMSFSGETVINMIGALRSNWALMAYIGDTDKTSENSSYSTYSLVTTISSLLENDITGQMSIIIVGINGVSYVSDGSGLAMPAAELLGSDITAKAAADPVGISYQFLSQGLTRATSRQRAFVAVAPVATSTDKEPAAYIYITISRQALTEYYSELSDSGNFIVLMDDSGRCVSSSSSDYIGVEVGDAIETVKDAVDKPFFEVEFNKQKLTCVARPVDYWGLIMVSIVDHGDSPEMKSATRYVLLVDVSVSITTIILAALLLNRLTHPLKKLTKRMSRLKSGDFMDRLPVSGEYEIQELTGAYNYMMDSIDSYLRQVKQIESQKRKAEILALQTQINPHFIYNTLSSVKWLIWRGENQKAATALELFITLMKGMASSVSEMIPFREEVEDLKNYAILQQIRYGDHIRIVFNINDDCMDLTTPKMILQPIIENAFFHAFADSSDGTISVFASKAGQSLVIEVIDDGAGFPGGKLECATCAQAAEMNGGFGGVGLSNVDERLRLLFGSEFGIAITSEPGIGTVITVTIPN